MKNARLLEFKGSIPYKVAGVGEPHIVASAAQKFMY